MFENGDPEHVHESGGEDRGISEDNPQGGGRGGIGGQGGEGAGAAAGTDEIGEDAVEGQTQHPAPEEDVGVPPDEDLSEGEQENGETS
jgi:hypothetical protein